MISLRIRPNHESSRIVPFTTSRTLLPETLNKTVHTIPNTNEKKKATNTPFPCPKASPRPARNLLPPDTSALHTKLFIIRPLTTLIFSLRSLSPSLPAHLPLKLCITQRWTNYDALITFILRFLSSPPWRAAVILRGP